MSNATAFLAKVLPWSKDPAAPAYFNLHFRCDGNNGKPYWDARACVDLTDMGKTLTWIQQRSDVRDIYVCMSSQKACEEKISKKGFSYRKGIRNAANAVALKSLFVDVDVKPGAYATTADASTAVRQFIYDSKLPAPTALVLTGSGGYHLHWTLDKAVPAGEWQNLAYALAHAVQKHGLKADTQCTIDSARILRVPDTKNFKSTPPRNVILHKIADYDVPLAQMQQALSPYLNLTKQVTAPHNPIVVGSELGAGIGDAAPRRIEDVARECGFIDNALKTGGKDHDNALWFLTTCIAVHCVDPRATAHRLGNRHPTYDAASTDKQYYRMKASHGGWPQCVKISASGATECKACPHFAANKSPLNHAAPPPAPPPALPPVGAELPFLLPEGYTRDTNNMVCLKKADENGVVNLVRVFGYPVLSGWMDMQHGTLHFLTITSAGKSPAEIMVPIADCNSNASFGKRLADNRIPLRERDVKALRDFIVAWINTLKDSKIHVISNIDTLGWVLSNKDADNGFSYGGRVWMPNSDRSALCRDAKIAEWFAPTGELQPWKDATRVIIDQQRPALNAIIAGAFAAPLIKLTGESGALASFYSAETGVHKTSAMRVGTAVWGSPETTQTMIDTQNSVRRRMTFTPSLPVFWDEIKTVEGMKSFAEQVYYLTQGVDKSRANPDASLKDRGTWSTMMISACNDSLIPFVNSSARSNNAGISRLFEGVVLPPAGNIGRLAGAEAGRLLEKLNYNYGHAGLIYAQYLGKNHVNIRKRFKTVHDELKARLNATDSERFWVATVATIYFGAFLAKECDLVDIPQRPLLAFLIDTFKRMRTYSNDSAVDMTSRDTIGDILSQFLLDMNMRHTLRTDFVISKKGKPPNNPTYGNVTNIIGPYVQVGEKDSTLRISKPHFETWLEAHDKPAYSVIEGIKAKFKAVIVKGALGAGTVVKPLARGPCLDIDLTNPACHDILDVF